MRIVLIRLSALGDVVHTWPLAVAIRAACPRAHLTWAVEEPLVPLVEGHPAVDAVITTATGRWRRRPFATVTRAEIDRLRSRFIELEPDLTIDSQGTLKSALVSRSTGAPRRVGLARPWRRELVAGAFYTETIPGSRSHPHVVATNLELVRAIGGEPPASLPPPDGRWLLGRPGVAPPIGPWGQRYAVVLPGAGHPDKILPCATVADAARHLPAEGIEVVVAWGPSERARAEEVAALVGAGSHIAPATGLLELTGLLGAATVVVGGDTGPVHLAASLGVPTLAVFITTDAERNRPIGAAVAVVSGSAPGRGPGGSAATGRARPVSAAEIRAAIDELLGSHE
jgi:lipopolysaccharide heptosyltransferase I